MKFSIRSFLIGILVAAMASNGYVGNSAFAQTTTTASILPPAKTTFFDQNGKPLTAGTVEFYIPGTTTKKTTWQDAAQTIPNTNPVVLDAAGRALILGSGSYRQIVKDKNTNVIWDQVTSSVGSGGGGGTSVGDGLLVGTILPWSGLIAPPNYSFAAGQEISRVTFPELLASLTSTQAVFCTAGSPTLSGVGDTTQLAVGTKIEVSCLASGSTIVSKTSSTVTASNNAITSVNTNAVFYPWGNGNGINTFNVPDLRGVTLAGRPNMGGTDKGNLTTAFFGTNPVGLGPTGGTQSHTQTIAEMPSHDHSVFLNDPGHTHGTNALVWNGANQNGLASGSLAAANGAVINSAVTNVTIWSGAGATGNQNKVAASGSGAAFSIIQPTTITNYIIKVTPDVSTSIASGVASLGGMTGVITCGANLICASGTIDGIPAAVLAGGTNGQIQYNCSSAFCGFTASGDATINTATGAILVTKSNNVSFGTAAFANTGASGHTIPYLDISNTYSALQSYSSISTASLTLSAITGLSQCLQVNSSGLVSGSGATCGGGGGGAVNLVSNSDGTLTISPTTGNVVASLALGHANTWTALQTYNSGAVASALTLSGVTGSTQCLHVNTSGVVSGLGADCGTGNVSSVSVTAGTGITQSGSPITTSGAITVNVDKATSANVYAAASNKVLTSDIVFGAAGALQAPTGCGTATVTPSLTSGFNFTCQLVTATNFTLANPSGLTSANVGQQGCIFFTQPASGTVVTIAYGTQWWASGGSSTQALTGTLSAQDVLCYFVVSTSELWFNIANAVAH